MDLCGERCLYYSLMAFWAVGLLMLIVQHPYDCKFFDLPGPGSGVTTPDKSADTNTELSGGRARLDSILLLA